MKFAIRLLARAFLNFISYTMNHHMRMLEKKILEIMPLPHHAYSHIWHRTTTTTTIIRNKYPSRSRRARTHTPCTISTILGAIIIAGIIFNTHTLSLSTLRNRKSVLLLLFTYAVKSPLYHYRTTLLCSRTHDPQPRARHTNEIDYHLLASISSCGVI